MSKQWFQSLLNYITNLQKENENLKEENKRIFSRVNDDELLISNAKNYAELQDYKSRNKKAIEKIVIKQARLINEKGYVITDLDLDEIMRTLESGE